MFFVIYFYVKQHVSKKCLCLNGWAVPCYGSATLKPVTVRRKDTKSIRKI